MKMYSAQMIIHCNFHRGLWNVPYVYHIFLVKADVLRTDLKAPDLFESATLDPDMAFCANVRNKVRHTNINQPTINLILDDAQNVDDNQQLFAVLSV